MMATILAFPGRMEPPRTMLQSDGASVEPTARQADTGPAWAALMVRAQDGDRAAYHALLHDITPYLRAIAHRYLGRGDDAEDAVQEILLVVHDIRHTYERARPFKPWLGTIATRRCIDLLRSRARRFEREVHTDDATAFDAFDADAPTPEDATARLHEARHVREAVATLSPRQREAIHLLHLRDLSLQEAAGESKQSVGALKVAAHRAIKALKDAIGRDGNTRDGGMP
jgi:RNA polymerase sigma-70 factor (ECF subfamily)